MQRLTTCSKRLGELLLAKHLTIATAESCTAGRISAAIASVDGASNYHIGGVVTYATALKEILLKIPSEVILRHGVVSEATVLAMNEGVRQLTQADVVISITGYAGSSGGDEFAENGTIWIAVGSEKFPPKTVCMHVHKSREENLQEATLQALQMTISYVESL